MRTLPNAVLDDAEAAGRGLRQIDHPALDVGAAVVDLDHDRAAVLEIGHLDLAAQRQLAVGCGEIVLVEALAAGGPLAVEAGAIPGRGADLPEGGFGGTRRLEVFLSSAWLWPANSSRAHEASRDTDNRRMRWVSSSVAVPCRFGAGPPFRQRALDGELILLWTIDNVSGII